jgi:hypothetical protein
MSDTLDSRLRCSVLSLSYDFATRTGRIDFPQYHCCDMSGYHSQPFPAAYYDPEPYAVSSERTGQEVSQS